jgi:hypothetical protein
MIIEQFQSPVHSSIRIGRLGLDKECIDQVQHCSRERGSICSLSDLLEFGYGISDSSFVASGACLHERIPGTLSSLRNRRLPTLAD